jgi:hypothetical protein
MIQVLNVQKQITKRNRNFTLQKLGISSTLQLNYGFRIFLGYFSENFIIGVLINGKSTFHKLLKIISIIKLSLILSFWNYKSLINVFVLSVRWRTTRRLQSTCASTGRTSDAIKCVESSQGITSGIFLRFYHNHLSTITSRNPARLIDAQSF